MNSCIVIDCKKLLDNPVKVLLEDIIGLTEIKEGVLIDFKNNPDFKGPLQVSSFYVTKTPLEISLWKILMNDNDRPFYRRRVEWDEYLLLLKTLKDLTKVDFSLPSSIQWEYATNTCGVVRMPSYEHNSYRTFTSVGLWDLYKRKSGAPKWCPPDKEDLPYQVLCSMGNGHEELFLFLATKDDFSSISYTDEEKEHISALIRKISYIQITATD